MPSTSGLTITSATQELETAQSLVHAGHLVEAEQAFRRALAADPEQVTALRFLAGAALRRGAAGEAIDLLNRAAQVDRNDIGTLVELGIAYRVADRMDASRFVLERALELGAGRDTTTRLLLANVLELDQRPELALLHYFRAILDAQHAGSWFDDATTLPGLQPLVAHAMRYVAEGRRALFEGTLQPWLAHLSAASSDRITRALAIYLRDRRESPPDPRQRPTLLYIPDLGTSPLPDLAQSGWLATLLASVATLGAEVDACLRATQRDAGTASPTAAPDAPADARAGPAAPLPAGDSRAHIYRGGTLSDAARRHAPQLLRALAGTPLMEVARFGPDAQIVTLPAATRTAMTWSRCNASCSVMVGLPRSADVEVSVGTDTHRLGAGGAIVGDRSYGIGYANVGAAEGRLLVFDIWHPGLSVAEREAVAALLATVVDFDTRLQELA